MKEANTKHFQSGRLVLRLLPIFVWLGAVACVIFLFSERAQRFEVVGLVHAQVRQVSSTSTGFLKAVPVRLFQEVNKRDIVAVLDDELLKARLITVNAEIARLQAELKATHNRLIVEKDQQETDMIRNQRRFTVDVENARLRILQLVAAIEPDRIMLNNLQIEIDIEKRLLQEDLVYSEYALSKAQIDYDALVQKIQSQENELAQAREVFEEAGQRLKEFAGYQPAHISEDAALDVIRKVINVQEKLIKELSLQREQLVLKAPFDGTVSQILHRSGESVTPGDPILIIAQTEPTEIIAYIGEDQVNQVREGMKVNIVKTSRPQQIISSQITYVGPAMEIMPERLWINPDFAQWGRPVLVHIPKTTTLKLIPGEKVGIQWL